MLFLPFFNAFWVLYQILAKKYHIYSGKCYTFATKYYEPTQNMKKVSLILLWMICCCLVSVHAQIRGNSIEVRVVPDHQDWRYEVGETASFKVCVTKSNTLLYNIRVDYSAGPEMYQNVKQQ